MYIYYDLLTVTVNIIDYYLLHMSANLTHMHIYDIWQGYPAEVSILHGKFFT